MKAVKTIAALIFLTALAIVLVQPVLGADDEEPAAKRKQAKVPPLSSDGDEGDGGVEITARYPKRCMRKTNEPPSGLVAARRGSTALIGFPDQRPAARVEVSGDVAWSPSGTFLAERGGRVFDQSGNPQGALFFEAREWQWSPVADCALATTERGSLTFSLPDTRRKGIRLLNAPVDDFDLSPNGRRLAVVIEGRGLWIADLRRGRVVQVSKRGASIDGWFSNRSVLFSKSKPGRLHYASGGEARIVRGAAAGGTLVRCGGRTLAVGPGRPITELTSRRGRITGEPLFPAEYSAAACSPDGSFMAASAIVRGDKGPLVLLAPDGTLVRELVPGATGNPTWSDDGLLFVRFGAGGRGRLWLVATNAAAPAPTEYTVGAPTQYDWHVR